MNFLISDAYAQAAPAAQPDMFTGFVLPMLFLVAVFYFLIIRPQSKRNKEHKKMLSDLAKGDEIATNGGLIGRIVRIGENFIEIEVADNIKVRVQKHAVASLMPKGTLKSSD
ncbi:MAG: preprotein translocase subunit YajC [Gammaproteobacteria bacterium]|nr:MAG: preprotein translocase subunit YajC [Gammaproteobacteria bacterium]